MFRLLAGDAVDTRTSATGRVGTVYSGDGIEAVWVSKDREAVDRRWFVQSAVDLILVLQGRLRVEFEDAGTRTRVLRRGELLILPKGTRGRAYRWPRSAPRATVFLAVYPKRRRAVPSRRGPRKDGARPT